MGVFDHFRELISQVVFSSLKACMLQVEISLDIEKMFLAYGNGEKESIFRMVEVISNLF